MSFYEIQYKIARYIRTECALGVFDGFTVYIHDGVGITGVVSLLIHCAYSLLPQTGSVETEMFG